MAGLPNSDDEIIGTINVTPLVDIMLVLLIIFMLVSSFVTQKAIEVTLPKASTGEKSEIITVSILISKNGDYFFKGKKMDDLNHMEESIKKMLAEKKTLQAAISADKDVKHGSVVNIIDLVRKLGIEKFAINIEPQE